MSLHIQNGAGYADVYKGVNIVARIWDDGSGGFLVKVLRDGHDTTAKSEREALHIITQRCCDESENKLGVSR